MKKLLFAALLFVSPVAMADSTPAGHEKDGGKPEMSFEQRKAKVLERMSARQAEMQKKMQDRLGCVQASTTPDALKACFPNRKERHEGKSDGDDGEHK